MFPPSLIRFKVSLSNLTKLYLSNHASIAFKLLVGKAVLRSVSKDTHFCAASFLDSNGRPFRSQETIYDSPLYSYGDLNKLTFKTVKELTSYHVSRMRTGSETF